jgi:hypothetical protein
MDYLASAIGIAAFTLLMNLWVHAPAQSAELPPISASALGLHFAAR